MTARATSIRESRFKALLDYLRRMRGIDFSGYKRTSLERRLHTRMSLLEITDYVKYLDYLEVHPEEFSLLLDAVLINVTSFFRDRAPWDYLRKDLIPRILKEKKENEPIRVWSAGCSSGEEAYSLAMVLAEVMGFEAFGKRVKLYASDVDDSALTQARAASYTAAAVRTVPRKLRQKYFTRAGDQFVFRGDLRRVLIFGHHDLLKDAPISRLDLLVCRNTMMYFNAEVQRVIFSRFQFALNDRGYLFLGRAEMLFTQGNLFKPLEFKHRIFTKAPGATIRDRLMVMAQSGDIQAMDDLGRHLRLRDAAFDAAPVAQMVLDREGVIVMINERMRSSYGLSLKDVGRSIQDLEISYRPVELRSHVDQAIAERRAIKAGGVERRGADGATQHVDISVNPLVSNGDSTSGVSVTFEDVTRYHALQAELQRHDHELETANEELQSAHEELETTNEELQSTNEELETTNEELQSTNEELETMNEELQSTNEELEAINRELHERTADSDRSRLFLDSVLASLLTGVVVIDENQQVRAWNQRCEELWGLRAAEVTGKAFFDLDLGLPLEQLHQPLRDALRGRPSASELVLDAVNRRGKAIKCYVTCAPLRPFPADAGKRVSGAVLLLRDLTQADRFSPLTTAAPPAPPARRANRRARRQGS